MCLQHILTGHSGRVLSANVLDTYVLYGFFSAYVDRPQWEGAISHVLDTYILYVFFQHTLTGHSGRVLSAKVLGTYIVYVFFSIC